MLKTVYLAENPLDLGDIHCEETENILEFLVSRYDKWPETARIYHNEVSQSNDVTPCDEDGIERLSKLEGKFYCIIYPADPVTILYAVVAIVAIAAAILLRPAIPTVSQRNTQSTSPNNELSSRSNQARPNGRIPDIFGKVRSTPDLLAVPFTTYVGNQEVETTLMCIGRGQYEIHDVYDDTTLYSQVPGNSIAIYKPNTSIVGASYYSVGTLTEAPLNVIRSNSVNGQVLRPSNSSTVRGTNDISFVYPDQIVSAGGRDFTDAFTAGDTIVVSNAITYANTQRYYKDAKPVSSNTMRVRVPSASVPVEYVVGGTFNMPNANFTIYGDIPVGGDGDGYVYGVIGTYYFSENYTIAGLSLGSDGGGNYLDVALNIPSSVAGQWSLYSQPVDYQPVFLEVGSGAILFNLAGTYSVLAVSTNNITLSNPASVNGYWNVLPGGNSGLMSPTLTSTAEKWVGPFRVEDVSFGWLYTNFIAANGLYKDNGKSQYAVTVDIEVQIQQIFGDGSLGGWNSYTISMTGSSVNKETRASTMKPSTVFVGDCNVRARRISPSDTAFDGTVVDEVKWKDLYRATELPNYNFGDVTIIRAQTYATAGALALKERKLNTLVTRQIPHWTGGTSFTAPISTSVAYDIITHIALDTKIGNRQISELDLQNIRDTVDTAYAYFGNLTPAVEFCYTFDKENLSFEETIQMVANAVFCLAYRRGNIIMLSFEKLTEDSTLLFNHRNKIPNTETRTVTFGNINDNDGVELEYVSPDDDAIVTYYLPTDRSAVNPKKIETVGVRNFRQAYFHAWRAFNKIRYQNIQVEFNATQEADLSIPNDRILVADNTRPFTQDGEVTGQSGLIIYTSQKLVFESGKTYRVFLQLSDKTVQAIDAIAGPVAASLVLSEAPRLPLAVDPSLYARTTYILVGNDDLRQRAFLVTEKITQDNMTSKIRAANYDARFYEHDTDYINGIV